MACHTREASRPEIGLGIDAMKLVELFCGCGGFSLGAHRAGFDVAAAYDIDETLPDDTKANQFDGAKYAEFGRKALGALLEKAVADADAGEADPQKKRSVKQLCFFKYKDGAPMITVGWLIVAGGDLMTFDACQFQALPFVRNGAVPFTVTIPLVTPLEVREMEKCLPNLAAATDLDWIPESERRSFGNVYRYLPQFSVVEQV